MAIADVQLLQELLSDMTTATIAESLGKLLESPIVTTAAGIDHLASGIVTAANVRPSTIPRLCQLAQALISASSAQNSLGDLKITLLRTLFRGLGNVHAFPHEASSICFLFQAHRRSVFDNEDVFGIVRTIGNRPNFTHPNCWLFLHFAPELDQADPALTQCIMDQIREKADDRRFPKALRKFTASFHRLRSRNWQRLRKHRNFFRRPQNFLLPILSDDVGSLKALTEHPGFGLDSRIAPSPFLPAAVLMNHPPLIHVAAFFRATNCFRWLISAGANPLECDRAFVTLPQIAVAGGDLEIIRICQQYSLDFSGTLHFAVRYHQNAIFDWLCDVAVAELDAPDIRGRRPLHCACESNNAYAIWRLLALGADPNAADYGQSTPLRQAVLRGHIASVELLLSAPALEVDALGPNGLTALGLAAKYGDVGLAKRLIARGASPAETPGPPLVIAARHGHLPMVQYLLTCSGVDCASVLLHASSSAWESIVVELVADAGVDVNIANANGLTALALAVQRESCLAFDALMARPDIDITVRTPAGATLLHLAVANTHMAAALLARGLIDVNAKDNAGETPLHRAAYAGNIAIVELLLAYPGIDVNARTGLGGTAIHHALVKRHVAVAEALIASPKIDINAQSLKWATAISLALSWGLDSVVRAICRRSDFDARGLYAKNAWPPLILAVHANRPDLLELLLANPAMRVEDDAYGWKLALKLALDLEFTQCASVLQSKWRSPNRAAQRKKSARSARRNQKKK
jgi:ankyrin repeat protein